MPEQLMLASYIPERFPKYLARKVDGGTLTSSVAESLLAAVVQPALPPSSGDNE